ncbi:hypothetical protein ACQEU8_28860 [Streptomyces sp. CA-250714]
MEASEKPAREREGYVAPVLIEIDTVADVTLGKYAEDSQDKGRYFE